MALKQWKAERVVSALSVLLAIFAVGFFLGRATRAGSSGEVIVQTQSQEPAQAEALLSRQSEDTVDSKKPEQEPDAADSKESAQALDTAAKPETVSAADDEGRINLNAADAASLCTLPGIGEKLAGRIIEYRESYGPFHSIEELMDVSGIGEKKFAAVKDLIYVGE